MRSVLAAALLVLAVPAAAQQMPPGMPGEAELKAAVANLKPLVGAWRGEGWIEMPGVPRQRFSSEEIVTEKLGGVALLIEGKHRSAAGQPDAGRLVHDALGILSYDPFRKSLRFRSTLATGLSGDFEATAEPGLLIWRTDAGPQTKIEYRTNFSDGRTWREVGRMSTDGGMTWVQTFEMTLKKVG